jgi:hypothetical protein
LLRLGRNPALVAQFAVPLPKPDSLPDLFQFLPDLRSGLSGFLDCHLRKQPHPGFDTSGEGGQQDRVRSGLSERIK